MFVIIQMSKLLQPISGQLNDNNKQGDSSSVSYSNADARKSFLSRISEAMGGLDISK